MMSFTEPASGWPFYFILSMVFFFGMMFGAVLAWFMIYPYFNRVTLIHSDIIPRPTFLMHALPREDRAPRPIESEPRRSQSTSSSTARAADAAGGTAGPISSALAAGSTARAADLPTSGAAGRGCWPRRGCWPKQGCWPNISCSCGADFEHY